ncbi:MAG: YdeI/OmpD-associated family protein [Actinomycetota bacterium]|nr:YdeI/OmpD-associated family protein [Actinomycetota bacterium]
MADDLPVLSFPDAQAWEGWLTAQPPEAPGVWMKIAKKGSGRSTVTYSEALDVALCHGWIDGQKGSFDAAYFLQRFTPRRARSRWSKVNVERVGHLTAAGRMAAAGLRQVELARADGRWEAAYAGQRSATVPPDLAAALAADSAAQTAFDALTGADRYSILYRVGEAKRPVTRAARIEKYVAALAQGQPIRR